MLVVALATLASFAVSASLICVRRATVTATPIFGVMLVLTVGCLIFPITAIATGDVGQIGEIPWQAHLLFAAAGVIHFVVGRSLNYFAIQTLGASRTTVIVTTYPLFALPIAVPVLDEPFSFVTAIGAALVIAGPIVMTRGEARALVRPVAGASASTLSQTTKGIAAAAGAAALLGLSFVLVKVALNESHEPVLGTTISYWAALIALGTYVVATKTVKPFIGLNRSAVAWYLAAALFVALSQIARYLALNEGDVTIVVILMQTVPIIVFALTFLMNRSIEALTGFVVIGSVLVVAGTALVVSQL